MMSMNPMNFFKLKEVSEEQEQQPDVSDDVNSLCYSSLSDENSEASEDGTKRKVMERQYSRLAFSVSRMGKDDQDGDVEYDISSDGPPNNTPVEIDLSTMNITDNDEKKQKVIDRKYSRLAFSVKQVGIEGKKY